MQQKEEASLLDIKTVSFAKVWPPREPRHGIDRVEILARLEEAKAYQLILVLSPAGYGKTTALAQHFNRKRKSNSLVAWSSLDEEDRNPRQFVSTIVEAFCAYDSKVGKSARAILANGVEEELGAAILSLLRDIGAVGEAVELICDDFHFAECAATLEIVNNILTAAPPNFSLIISSRFVPKMDVATIRVRGQLMEIGTDDLRFSGREAEAYIEKSTPFSVKLGEIAELNHHASGWPLGLQAATISLSQIGDARKFIDQYDASSTDLSRFIGTNIFADLDGPLKTFLLEIAQLESFNAELCSLVTGEENAGKKIDELERRNLFIEPSSAEAGWFRFHGLFREFLLCHSDAPSGKRSLQIHKSAYQWLLTNGFFEPAIRHAFNAELWNEAADLIEASWRQLVNRAQFDQLKEWLYGLPSDFLEDRPVLQVAIAWTESLQRRPDLASGRIAQLMLKLGLDRTQLHPDFFESKPITRDLFALQASIDLIKDDAQEIGRLAHLEDFDFASLGEFQHGLILNCLSYARMMVGQFDGAQRLAQQVRQISQKSGHILIGVHSDLFAGFAHQVCGDLKLAHQMFEHAHERTLQTFSYPYAAPQYLMSAILFEWNKIEEAKALLELSKDALVVPSVLGPIIDLYLTRARVAWAQGEQEKALSILGEADLAGRDSGSRRLRVAALAERARILLSLGILADAQQIEREMLHLAGENRSHADSVWPRSHSMVTQTSALIRIAEGRADTAKDIIEPNLNAARSSGRVAYAIKYLAIDAVASHELGDKDQAIDVLASAFALGSSGRWMRTFFDYLGGYDGLVAGGLNRALAKGVTAEYLQDIASLLKLPDTSWLAVTSNSKREIEIERLTVRERELLLALSAGKTNKEIARLLGISDNTVAWHLKNLFAKLNVNTRTEAANEARLAGIVH